MSENPDQWEEMLRAVLGNEAADRMIEQMRSQGIDPGAQMSEMMNPTNFNQIVNQVHQSVNQVLPVVVRVLKKRLNLLK